MTYSELFSAGDTFNWDGDSHSKHALKGTNGVDGINPFGGRAVNMIKDGAFNETKYGVDLGGRGNNSLFNLNELANDGADFSIRLHGVGPSIETAREIFGVQGKKTYVDVTDGAGHLAEGFKDLLDAAFDLGDYADAKDDKDSDGFAGRVLHNGDNFVFQIAAEGHHGDDGAAEIMTFSGDLAKDMMEHLVTVEDKFDEAKVNSDEFAFALDANYVESDKHANNTGVSIVVQGDYEGDQVLRVINWDTDTKDVKITSNKGEETPEFNLPGESHVFVRMGQDVDGTSYFLNGKSATSGSKEWDTSWELDYILADTSHDFFG